MPVINVLYLPRDGGLRLIVKTALDLVEEVYRDDTLSGLRFFSFVIDDDLDVEQVKHVAFMEGLTNLVKRTGHGLEPIPPYFYIPHYQTMKEYAWAPLSMDLRASSIFRIVAHEVTHHAIRRLPEEGMSALLSTFRADVDLNEIIRRHKLLATRGLGFKLAFEIRYIVDEVATKYIVHNYFLGLEREPEMPTFLANIQEFALEEHRDLARRWPEPEYKQLAEALSDIYMKMAYKDLVQFRKEVHEWFANLMIKKLPVDVLKSNRAKYEILYIE
jgi:hypothetical protein